MYRQQKLFSTKAEKSVFWMKVNLRLKTFIMIYHLGMEKGKSRLFLFCHRTVCTTQKKKKKKNIKGNNFFPPRLSNFSYQYKRLQYRSQHAQLSVMFISGSQY